MIDQQTLESRIGLAGAPARAGVADDAVDFFHIHMH